ncbi:MAG TPA: HAD hydrolase family protein [Gemmataceae bacterium]|nr:HAD hydrolase family protein [Gemmataceae bacterium]
MQTVTLAERCRAVRLLVLDVDGVLTDGGIVYGTGGLEVKRFHVRDGAGIKLWRLAGRRSALITGRTSPVVDARAAEQGIDFVFQGALEKLPAYQRLLHEAAIEPSAVCYVGDDEPDLPLLRNCGLAVAVADGCREARAAAHYVTRTPGGCGAVRETIELILRCQGEWGRLIERSRNGASGAA